MSIVPIILLSLMIISIIIIFIYYKIQLEMDLKEINKEYEELMIKQENRNKAINRLTGSLATLCKLLNIDLSYHDYLDIAAGKIVYKSIDGRLIVDEAKIQILNKYKDEPYVLAHELGHYMAIKQRGDDTEEGADAEALNICKAILTPEEQNYMANELLIFFESNKTV